MAHHADHKRLHFSSFVLCYREKRNRRARPRVIRLRAKSLSFSEQMKNCFLVRTTYCCRYHAAFRKMKELIQKNGGKVMAFQARCGLRPRHYITTMFVMKTLDEMCIFPLFLKIPLRLWCKPESQLVGHEQESRTHCGAGDAFL